MGLSELVSHLELWIYPVVGLLGFCLAFALQAIRVSRVSRAELEHNGSLPLRDGSLDTRPEDTTNPGETREGGRA